MLVVAIADTVYCPIVFSAPCLKPEVWAAWAQALLSAAAIYFAAVAATAPDRLAKRRKAKSYLALLDIAQEMLSTCAEQKPGLIMLSRLKQVAGQFAEVNVENVPDYRLLLPMQETHGALTTVSDLVERRINGRQVSDQSGVDGLLQEMGTAYGDLLRVRREAVAVLVEEIAPQNWFLRLAAKTRRA